MANALPLKRDVDVTVNLSPRSIPRKAFNIGLLIGLTNVIDTDERVKFYGDLTEMIDDGFATDDALYLGARTYFNQEGNLGASLPGICIGAVATNSTSGVVEDLDDVILDCRKKNADWYAFTTVDVMTDAKIELLADTVESMNSTFYFANTQSAGVKAGTEGNIAEIVKLKSYKKTAVVYHEDADFSCGALGYAMGATTGLINSAFTMKFKTIVGKIASNLTSGEANNIEGNYANCYVTTAKAQFEEGTCANGSYMDEIFNLDKLANDIQLNVYDLLYSLPKEAQTDAGQADIAGMIGQACEQARKINFIATGKWRKSTLLDLQKGDVVPNGYLIQWDTVDNQSDADRDARKAQPFYVCLTLAGAMHSVVIQVNVSR